MSSQNITSFVIEDLKNDGTLSKFTMLPCGGLGVDSDTYWNELHTATAARYQCQVVRGVDSAVANWSNDVYIKVCSGVYHSPIYV